MGTVWRKMENGDRRNKCKYIVHNTKGAQIEAKGRLIEKD